MKILCAEYNANGEVAVVPAGDDVLLRNNGDFYIPDFSSRVSCVPQLIVRVCKLGKCIEERFTHRYFEEIGVGIRFYADDREEELQAMSLPGSVASTFDSSAAISPMIPVGMKREWEYDFRVNDQLIYRGNSGCLPLNIEKLLAEASGYHTLKIGDFLFCGDLFRYRELKIGDRLRLSLEGEELLDFKIK